MEFKNVPPPPGFTGTAGDNYFIIKARQDSTATDGALAFRILKDPRRQDRDEEAYIRIVIPVRFQ